MHASARRSGLALAGLLIVLPACQPAPPAVAPLNTSLQAGAAASPAVREAFATGTIVYGELVDRRDDPFSISYDANQRPTGRAIRGVVGAFDAMLRRRLVNAGVRFERLAEPSRPRLDMEIVEARAVEDHFRFAAKVELRVTLKKPTADAAAWSKTFSGHAETDRELGPEFAAWWSPMNRAIELACAHAIDAMLVDDGFAAALASK